MKAITKKELIQFIKDNCYVSEYYKAIHWNWVEDVGSQSSKKINEKIFVLLGLGEQQ